MFRILLGIYLFLFACACHGADPIRFYQKLDFSWPKEHYIGFDYGYRNLSFKESKGRETFRHHMLGARLYTGTVIGEIFGIETGFYGTLPSYRMESQYKAYSFYANILHHAPLNDTFRLFGGFGLSRITLNYLDKDIYCKVSKTIPSYLTGLIFDASPEVSFRITGSWDMTHRAKNYLWVPRRSTSLHGGLMVKW